MQMLNYIHSYIHACIIHTCMHHTYIHLKYVNFLKKKVSQYVHQPFAKINVAKLTINIVKYNILVNCNSRNKGFHKARSVLKNYIFPIKY